MDIRDLEFPDSPANVATADMISRIGTFKDANNVRVFGNVPRVSRGIGLGEEPTIANTPACRLWVDFLSMENDSVQFQPRESAAVCSLYLYFYAAKKTSDRHYVDFQKHKQALCEALIRHLWEPAEDNTTGFTPRNGEYNPSEGFIWRFKPQTVVIDHTSVFKRINQNIILKEPFSASRIDIEFEYFISV